MAQGRTTTIEQTDAVTAPPTLDTGFGAEFRELARQRRFVRSAGTAAAAEPASDWRSQVGQPAAAVATPVPPATPVASTAPVPARPSRTKTPAPVAPAVAAAPAAAPRLSEDQRAMVRELSRMSDQLVDARERLAVATSRVAQLEGTLVERSVQLRDANDRVTASHLLVQDAQKAAHEVAERCAFLEARSDALEHALELAVNASWLTRWKWRREQRRAAARS